MVENIRGDMIVTMENLLKGCLIAAEHWLGWLVRKVVRKAMSIRKEMSGIVPFGRGTNGWGYLAPIVL
jgi:hypothetical protein